MKPELIRRHEIPTTIRKLDEGDLFTIVTRSKISHLLIREEAYLRRDNVKICRDDDYAHMVAKKAAEQGVGASGIKSVVEGSLKVATRKIRLLNGEGGTLVLKKETVTNPRDFELYRLNGEKVYSYTPEENGRVKTIGTNPNGS